jgi:hypothetical protein
VEKERERLLGTVGGGGDTEAGMPMDELERIRGQARLRAFM